jgi:hypothetical protein
MKRNEEILIQFLEFSPKKAGSVELIPQFSPPVYGTIG